MLDIINVCIKNYIPFAVYRLPYQYDSTISIQSKGMPLIINNINEINKYSGFLVTPFDIGGLYPTVLLQPNFILPLSEIENDHVEKFLSIATFDRSYYSNGKDLFVSDKKLFTEQVKAIQQQINDGIIKKAVLSRIHIENRDIEIQLTKIYNTLCKLYSDAFVYLLQIPYVGCWIGATPEPFIRFNNKNVEIESIAGTIWLGENEIKEVVWGDKEIEEQELVSNFIEDELKHMGINQFEVEGPTTLKAGNLAHLKTLFRFDIKWLDNKLGNFIQTLHPTPSVCGLPQQDAMNIIKKIELHSREYYTGILGPINLSGTTQLFTNIRCMKANINNFEIFLGAGITRASNPIAEWNETNYKKTTLLSAIELTLNRNK